MKTILIDWSLFVHRAVFSCIRRGEPQYTQYMCMKMILGCLNKIEITSEDIIIFAVDSTKGNWRKDVDLNYKGNRAEKRKKSGIDWEHQYGLFAAMLVNLENATPFHILEIDRLEADDIIAGSCRFYQDREVVIISTDSDYDQLVSLGNVQIFSPVTKKYKIVTDSVHQIISRKIKKEVTDNLITPIRTVEDYERRNLLVNLTQLPEDIENLIIRRLKLLPSRKTYNVQAFKFPKMIRNIEGIYNNETKQIVAVSDSFKKKLKKINSSKIQTLF